MEIWIIADVLLGLVLIGITLWDIKKKRDPLTVGELFSLLFVCFCPGLNIVAIFVMIEHYKLLDKRIF